MITTTVPACTAVPAAGVSLTIFHPLTCDSATPPVLSNLNVSPAAVSAASAAEGLIDAAFGTGVVTGVGVGVGVGAGAFGAAEWPLLT